MAAVMVVSGCNIVDVNFSEPFENSKSFSIRTNHAGG